jgi:DNA polymerase I
MGILATEPHQGERIIVSQDKDMQTIPGLLYNPNKHILGVRSISPEEAERFMLWQAICGDQTDGYPGCPGSGPAAAERLLDGFGWETFTHTFKSGPRKGQTEDRWREVDMGCRWAAIVSAYEKAGLGEADAVIQVNLARILKASDFDGKRPIRWAPGRVN